MQQLSNGKFRLTNTQTGQTVDVNFADLPKYGVNVSQANNTGFIQPDANGGSIGKDILDAAANAAPTIGGIAGSVLGTGADEFLGPAGTIAGGAGGGALGDIIKQLIQKGLLKENNSGFDPTELAKSAAVNGLFGAIPGGDEGAGIIANTVKRAVGGGIVGGTAQGVEDIGSNKSPGSVANDIVGGAAGTAALNTTLFPGFEMLSKFLGDKIPEALINNKSSEPFGVEGEAEQALKPKIGSQMKNEAQAQAQSVSDKYNQEAQNLETQAKQTIAGGLGRQQFAENNQLISPDLISEKGLKDSQTRGEALLEQQNKIFDTLTKDENGNPLTASDTMSAKIKDIMDSSTDPSLTKPVDAILKDYMGGASTQQLPAGYSLEDLMKMPEKTRNQILQASGSGPINTGRLFDSNGQINLNELNKMRLDPRFRKLYKTNPVARQVYSVVKQQLEDGISQRAGQIGSPESQAVLDKIRQTNENIHQLAGAHDPSTGFTSFLDNIEQLQNSRSGLGNMNKLSGDYIKNLRAEGQQEAQKIYDTIDSPEFEAKLTAAMRADLNTMMNEAKKGNMAPLQEFISELKNSGYTTENLDLLEKEIRTNQGQKDLHHGIRLLLTIIPILGYASPLRFLGYIFGREVEGVSKRALEDPVFKNNMERKFANIFSKVGHGIGGTANSPLIGNIMNRVGSYGGAAMLNSISPDDTNGQQQ